MTVKDDVGRTRYVVFRVVEGAPLPRRALEARLPEAARLTRFDGRFGVVRTTHRRSAALVEHLRALREADGRAVAIETLRTSGTMRAASRSLPPETATRASKPDRFK